MIDTTAVFKFPSFVGFPSFHSAPQRVRMEIQDLRRPAGPFNHPIGLREHTDDMVPLDRLQAIARRVRSCFSLRRLRRDFL